MCQTLIWTWNAHFLLCEFHQDLREFHQDLRELRQDLRELHQDLRELYDFSNGTALQELGQLPFQPLPLLLLRRAGEIWMEPSLQDPRYLSLKGGGLLLHSPLTRVFALDFLLRMLQVTLEFSAFQEVQP